MFAGFPQSWPPPIRPTPPFYPRRPLTQVYAIHCVLPVYMLGLVIAEYAVGSDGLRGYLVLFSPLHEITSGAMSIIRRHEAQLLEVGLTNRALFVIHLYAIAGIYVISSVFLISLIQYRAILHLHKTMVLKGKKTENNIKVGKYIIYFSLILIFMNFIYLNFITIKLGEFGRFSWRVDVSNLPFIMVFLWAWFNSILMYMQIAASIKLRIVLWGVVEGTASPRSDNEAK